ncbi:hypothetical protein AVEN_194146-1 [Araneus ventricosus]|uniref:Uncharacterized protein n=1 Tax=Araneus ventricosus TaxID=182803 RepID=A0A4Y2Q2J7_ARAVE|nr:hypothetical protein AVEN_194146-1 [Araneus ventricosus]
MTQGQKISHFIKGEADDMYYVLIKIEVCTVDQLVTCCRKVDATNPISTANEEDLRDLIRWIVEEEVQKFLPQIPTCTDD